MRPMIAAGIVAVLAASPAHAAVCIDQGVISSLQVSGNGPNSQMMQIALDGRANYVSTASAVPGAFAGLAAMATAAYLSGRPVRVGFEQGQSVGTISFLEMPTQLTVPSVKGCPARGLAPARPQ